jgi:serine phosphatase RsbU (regulator of sigma subunit)
MRRKEDPEGMTVRRSFRSVLVLIIVLSASLPVLLFSSLLVHKIHTVTSAAAVKELALQVQGMAEGLHHETDLLRFRLLTLADNRDIAMATKKTSLGVRHFLSDRAMDYVREFLANIPLVTSMYLLDSDAQVVETAPASVATLPPTPVMATIQEMLTKTFDETTEHYVFVTFSDADFLAQTLALLDTDQRAPLAPALQSAHGLALVVPLILDVANEVKGALVGIIPFDRLATRAFSRVEPHHVLTFEASDGTLLARSQADTIMSGAASITQETPLAITNSAHGQAIHYRLRLSESTERRFAEVRTTLVRLIMSVLGAVLLLIGFAYVVARWLVSPLGTLTGLVQAYAGGDYDVAPPPMPFAEFQRFVATLRDMGKQILAQVTALRHSQEQLEDANRTLEQRVDERTAQLAQANAAITTLNARLQSENLRMGAELDVTRKLQQMLLPTAKELQQIADLDIACYMEPADEVGGDYYDVLQHNGQIKIGIGDVTGHGLESGVLMVMTQAIVRALLANGETDPVRFLDALNRTLYGNVQRMGTDKNLTLALLDYAAGEVRLSGQHENMLVVRGDGTVEVVDTIDLGFPVALTDEIADFIHHTTVRLQPGDGVVLYTDGITEAEDLVREQYSLARLCTVVSRHWTAPAEVIKECVVRDVYQHMGAQRMYDDITLVVVKRR